MVVEAQELSALQTKYPSGVRCHPGRWPLFLLQLLLRIFYLFLDVRFRQRPKCCGQHVLTLFAASRTACKRWALDVDERQQQPLPSTLWPVLSTVFIPALLMSKKATARTA
ncbi:unnamed protein product [Dibothriocephalus latus]|uniref:Uncharacterized protein n=1 Tax=Dibothriocephalus latus TaxID=60516 RepID=A0A3P6Q2I9_DIBLA|nr:unnamed protein product [Dibothriocephalus latus]